MNITDESLPEVGDLYSLNNKGRLFYIRPDGYE